MDRGSSKHGRILDEQMEREVRGIVQGGADGRSDESRDPEAPGEDQPNVGWEPNGPHGGGTPFGMTPEEVEARSRLGRYIPRSRLPGTRDDLIAGATELLAPDDIIDTLKGLPAGEAFRTVSEVWEALGHRNEDPAHRP
jgi:hypothetical protein